jgi:Ca2+-binding EF-hand superfamily protein
MFQIYDQNNDGFIDEEEFKIAVKVFKNKNTY